MRRALALVVALGLAGAGCAHLPGHDHGAASEQDAASDPDPADHGEHADHADHADQGDAPEDGPAAGATPHVSDTDFDALFSVDCGFSHRASDDPIVFPGQPGASHSHDFFGSEATDASSTGASLLGTPTTCEDPEDTASYWVPTLSVDGTPVTPSLLRAYYRARPGVDVRDVTAPPLGLAMIAGDPARGGDHDHGDGGDHDHGTAGAGATTTTTEAAGAHDHATDDHAHHGDPSVTTTTVVPAEDDPTVEAGWGCGFRPRALHVTPPTDCTDASPLTLRLRFPDCWNGEDLDSPDHRSHVARSVDGECPEGYPVLMSELQVSVVWPVTGEEAASVTLSSGGVAGAHGDFLNGWDPEALDSHVALCIHAEANCTIG